MGAIADATVAFAQPLLNQTDGSIEQMNRAFAISQLCWNLALLPEEERDTSLSKMRPSLGMDDDEFDAFRQSVVIPMIQRHHEMFPKLHQHSARVPSPNEPSLMAHPRKVETTEKYPGTEPYSPCPCNSGKKYKFCCKLSHR